MQVLENLLHEAKAEIQAASDLPSLDQCRVHYLGKKGRLTECLKSLGTLSVEERPKAGQKINAVKESILGLLEEKTLFLKAALIDQEIARHKIDITLPGRMMGHGSVHPVSQTIQELKRIFSNMGFLSMEGPEIEDDYHNFTALNVPLLHPARTMQDTFYFADNTLLRTQMSPVQIRAMQQLKPPFRMIAMGRVYRRDFDITHTPMFHQMECLMLDEQLSFADLKGLLTYFLHEFFGEKINIRFRPSYFPFTEPSAEVDIGCLKCNGEGCRICKNTGFLEVLGCGMVHPHVLQMANIDAECFRGFAMGLGVDRFAMLKHGISDLRALFENDIRFLNQF